MTLTSAVGELRTNEDGSVAVPASAVETLRPSGDSWRVAPAGVDPDGALWVVGRLRVRACCTLEGSPLVATNRSVAVVDISRPVGVSLEERLEDYQSFRARNRWLEESGLVRERHSVCVQDGGIVEILTWETPSQTLRIHLKGATGRSSPAVRIPPSGVDSREPDAPIVEVMVPLDEVLFEIAGRVVTADGRPVEDAVVLGVILRRMNPRDVDPSVLKPQGHTLGVIKRPTDDYALVTNDLSARTGQDGRFRLVTPIDGEETLLVVHQPGYERGEQRIPQLSQTDASDLDIVLRPTPTEVRCVLRKDKRSLPEGSLVLIDIRAVPQYHFSVEVKADGSFPTAWLTPERLYHLFYRPYQGDGFLLGNILWRRATTLDYEDLERGRSTLSARPDGADDAR